MKQKQAEPGKVCFDGALEGGEVATQPGRGQQASALAARDDDFSWDFVPAISYIQTYASLRGRRFQETDRSQEDNGYHDDQHGIGLGEFGPVWRFLGIKEDRNGQTYHGEGQAERVLEIPATSSNSLEKIGTGQASTTIDHNGGTTTDRHAETFNESIGNDLTSKGGAVPSHHEGRENEEGETKGVRWRDELDGAELADTDEIDPTVWLAGLTKTQRKKARRKQRRASKSAAPPCSSDNDSDYDAVKPLQDRKALIHDLLERPLPLEPHVNSFSALSNSVAVPDAPKTPSASSVAATAAVRKRLMALIKHRFAGESPYLDDDDILGHFCGSAEPTHDGLHIFIDASNIMIGFHDALKLARGQPLSTRIRRQPISFHSLSLILSRGRATAKRVIVGSDKVPEMIEARQIGYEISILDRVHKAKEVVPRSRKSASGSGYGTQSAGSGSEAAAATHHAPEKWVEQAVDEILHLKMMESVVDASQPATMILATGDAAEAEFSGGFLKMVERVLQKGWRVELASFRHNISQSYRRHDFRQKWGDAFRIVELDEFVECLLACD